MKSFCRFFSYLFSFQIFALSTTASAISAIYGSTILFPIDPTMRGKDIVELVASLSSAPYSSASSEVGLQTTLTGTNVYAPAVVNGFIPNILSILAAPNSTLLLVTYLNTPRAGQPQYIVVPVEQIIDVIYSTLTIPTSGFTSTMPSSSLSYFPIDLPTRAADIVSIVQTLLTQKPYKTASSVVAIQTTLTGPFYPSFTGGLIPKIQSISLNFSPQDTMLLITYQASNYQLGTVIVGVDQIIQIIYYPTF